MTALAGWVLLAHRWVEAACNSLWLGLLVVGAAALGLGCWRTNAATRAALWLAVLVALAGLPLVAATRTVEVVAHSTGTVPAKPAVQLSAPPAAVRPTVHPVVRSPLERLAAAWWPLPVALAWLGVVGVRLVRLVLAYRGLARLRAESHPLGGPLARRPAAWLAACGPGRPMDVRTSDAVAVPTLVGLVRPVVLVPSELLAELTVDEFDQVGLHELAHVRRYDDWTNLMQKLVEAVCFFQPAVWWVAARLDLEREVACDDRVVALTGQSRPYALCLARLLELTGTRSEVAPAALAVSRQLRRRIELLLDRERNRAPRLAGVGLAVGLAALSGALVLCARTAPVIALPLEPSLPFAGPEPTGPTVSAPAQRKPAARPAARPLPAPVVQPAPAATTHSAARPARVRPTVATRPALRRTPAAPRLVQAAYSGRPAPALLVAHAPGPAEENDAALAERMRRWEQDFERSMAEAEAEAEAEVAQATRAAEPARPAQPVRPAPRPPVVSDSELIALLVERAKSDPSSEVRREAIAALARLESETALDALVGLYDSSDERTRRSIISGLAQSNSRRAVQKLTEIARSDSNPQLRRSALRALTQMSDARRSRLIEFPDIDVRMPDIDIRMPDIDVRTPKIIFKDDSEPASKP